MKAAVYESYGGPDSLVIREIDPPTPLDSEILVKVEYAAINPIDWKIGEGRLKAYLDYSFPLIVGRDIAGTVADPNNNGQFALGDKVIAALPGPGGGLAEYVSVSSDHLTHAPRTMSLEGSASFPLVGLTCWQGLIEFAALSKEQVIFILSGAGGTGSFAIQVAKSVGARVITTCSPGNHDYVKRLGADIVFDYKRRDVVKEIQTRFPEGIDLVFSNVLGELHEQSYGILRRGGKLVTIGEPLSPGLGQRYGVEELDFVVSPNGEQLKQIVKLVESGLVVAPETKTYPFTQIGQALSDNMSGHTRGKIIVEMVV